MSTTTSSLQYISERVESVRVLHLYGAVDVPHAMQLRDALGRVTSTSDDRILIDLEKVDLLDSSGLGVLVAAQRRASKVGARFALAAPRERVARVLRMTGTANILDVHDTVEDGALALQAA